MLDFSYEDGKSQILAKRFNVFERRDTHGRWTTGNAADELSRAYSLNRVPQKVPLSEMPGDEDYFSTKDYLHARAASHVQDAVSALHGNRLNDAHEALGRAHSSLSRLIPVLQAQHGAKPELGYFKNDLDLVRSHQKALSGYMKGPHPDEGRISELEQQLGRPVSVPSDAQLEADMGMNDTKLVSEMSNEELEAELARRRAMRAAAVGKAVEPDIEKVGPHGYIHGWVYVGVGKDDAVEDKAERVSDNVLAHRGGSDTSRAGHKEAARLHRQAANASSSDEAIAYHKQMAQLHRAASNGRITNAQAKAKARRVRTGSKAKPVGHAADKLNMIGTMKERRALARSLSDKELEKTDEEFQKRAKALGKEGQVSRAHRAVRDEIEGRRGSKRGSSIRDSLPDEDFAGPHRSYPIITPKDLGRAASLAHHAADPEAIRQRLREIAQRKFPGQPLPPSLATVKGISMDDLFLSGNYDLARQAINKSFADRVDAFAAKVGPHGYVHGWVRVGDPGSQEHDRALNQLGGLAANHSQEAADAVDRARTAAREGRFSTAKDHLDNAAFLLHASGRHSLARAAEDARDSFSGAVPPTKAPHTSAPRVSGAPAPFDSAREFQAVQAMDPGIMPVGSSYAMTVPGQNRVSHKSVDEYEMAKQQIMANRIAMIMNMNASRYTSTVGNNA